MFFVSICGPWQGSCIEKRLFRADTQVGPYEAIPHPDVEAHLRVRPKVCGIYRQFRGVEGAAPYAFYRYYTQTPNSYFLTPN